LVAVTKSVPVERVQPAVAAGVLDLGENRLQEALTKIDALNSSGVAWHFIGRLQRRKIKTIVGRFELIHSVDSVELAAEINRRAEEAGLRQRILLEVNLGEEASKGGFAPRALEDALPALGAMSHLSVEGLMAIPPYRPDPESARPYFRSLRMLASSLMRRAGGNVTLQELSMGMSHDYEIAVEEGATMVRVGTAIFGDRPLKH
jgi:pyridoxal phosphate enzyme (YggS family)